MATTINKKINHIYLLLEKLSKGEELYPQNIRIQEELEVNERTLRRYLEDIYELYSHIVTVQKTQKEFSDRKVTIYRVVDKQKDVSEIFKFFLNNSDDLSWLLQLVHENNPSLLRDYKDDAKESLEKMIKADEDVFLFVGSPFESAEDTNFATIFSQLKTAVKNHEYRDIDYDYDTMENLKNIKCLKLVYMNNNWYMGVETDEDEFRFLRLAFIKNIHYSKSKISYKPSSLKKYQSFFDSLQNAMSINKPSVSAVLKASSKVAIYFSEGMKLFFPSQKFIKKHDDGSVEFSIDYTNYLEIAPFVKQWQPDIVVISPSDLREKIKNDLIKGVENHRFGF